MVSVVPSNVIAFAPGADAIGGTWAGVIGGAPAPRGVVFTTFEGGSGVPFAPPAYVRLPRLASPRCGCVADRAANDAVTVRGSPPRRRWAVECAGDYSGSMPAAFTTLPHFTVSSAWNFASSSGVVLHASTPLDSK